MADVLESAPQTAEQPSRWNVRNALIGFVASVGLLGGVAWVASTERAQKPEFLISGMVPEGSDTVDLQGAVNLKCVQNGGKAVVNATVRLVTDRLNDDASPRGRIVKAQVQHEDEACADALHDVRQNPQPVIDQVVDNVGSLGTDVFGDGDFPTAGTFEAVIKQAREDNVQAFAIK